jgi:hypothetical protein
MLDLVLPDLDHLVNMGVVEVVNEEGLLLVVVGLDEQFHGGVVPLAIMG